MTDKFIKSYAAIKSNWISDNLLDEYLPYVATIILDENLDEINSDQICTKLNAKYDVTFQPTLVSQILSNAVEKGVIKYGRGRYVADKQQLEQYYIKESGFSQTWDKLLNEFLKYARKHHYYDSREKIEDNISEFIDVYDDHVIFNHIDDIDMKENTFLYHWCNFILQLSNEQKQNPQEPHLYQFILGLCMANIVKSTLFYSSRKKIRRVDLHVYLDTPMVFALLGMDTPERKNAYQYIIQKIQNFGIGLSIFDHNLDEVKWIIDNAISWVNREDYDISKATRVAQYFRDSGMSTPDMNEYLYNIEAEINRLGITVVETNYDQNHNLYQDDEEWLAEEIKKEYGIRAQKYSENENFETSLKMDVRSIVMVDRKRRNCTSTTLNSAKHLFLTTNGAIARVSKEMMRRKDHAKNSIPACVTADIFGTLLWMDFPDEENNYQSLKLLADCKSLLTASPRMLELFQEKLNEARLKKDSGLDEDTFLFLRSHNIVKKALLDVTTGDYAQFTNQTPEDVYKRIKAEAQYEGDQKYKHEKEEHNKTQKQLKALEKHRENDVKQFSATKSTLEQEIAKIRKDMEKQDQRHNAEIERLKKENQSQLNKQKDKSAETLAKIITFSTIGLLQLFAAVIIVFVQNHYSEFSVKNVLIILATILIDVFLSCQKNKFQAFIKNIIKKGHKICPAVSFVSRALSIVPHTLHYEKKRPC